MNRFQATLSRIPALLALVVVAFGGQAAAQAPSRSLGVIIAPGKGTDPKRVLEVKPAFRHSLRLLDGVALKDPTVLMAPGAETEFNSQVNAAFSALNSKDFAGARQMLAGIEERMLGLPASDDRVFLARFYKAYGCALVGSGLMPEGVARIKTSLFLFGEQAVDEYAYSADTRDAFLQARREIQDVPNGGLEFSSIPGGAEVYIDGQFAGVSPLKIDRLAAGNHAVRTAASGYDQRFQIVQVASGARTPALAQMTPAPFSRDLDAPTARLMTADTPTAAGPDMAALKTALGADELGFVVLTEEPDAFAAKGFYANKEGKAFDVDDRIEKGAQFADNVKNFVAYLTGAQVREEAKVTSLGRPVAVSAAAAAQVESGDDLILDPNSPMFAELKKKKEQKSILTEWWFITGVAVLAAGAATGIYFLTRGSGASSSDPTGSMSVTVLPY